MRMKTTKKNDKRTEGHQWERNQLVVRGLSPRHTLNTNQPMVDGEGLEKELGRKSLPLTANMHQKRQRDIINIKKTKSFERKKGIKG